MLNSAVPLNLIVTPAAGPHGVTLSWYAVEGELYAVEVTRKLYPPNWQLVVPDPILATTPFSAYELPRMCPARAYSGSARCLARQCSRRP